MSAKSSGRYCGRYFSAVELTHIRELLRLQPALHRAGLSRRICQDLDWRNAGGQLKEMSCRVALLRMEKDGLLQLPKPLCKNGNGQVRPLLTPASEEPKAVLERVSALEPLVFRNVPRGGADSRLWNELIQRHHITWGTAP
jgi:hypothetical protein